jgi:growth differentiation factor 10
MRTILILVFSVVWSTCFDSNSCNKKNLIINFKEIGWDWIISPISFNAYFCAGDCSDFSDSSSLRTSMMLSFMTRYKNFKRQNSFCCVPTKKRSMLVIYRDNSTVKVMLMPNMIVEKCVCS